MKRWGIFIRIMSFWWNIWSESFTTTISKLSTTQKSLSAHKWCRYYKVMTKTYLYTHKNYYNAQHQLSKSNNSGVNTSTISVRLRVFMKSWKRTERPDWYSDLSAIESSGIAWRWWEIFSALWNCIQVRMLSCPSKCTNDWSRLSHEMRDVASCTQGWQLKLVKITGLRFIVMNFTTRKSSSRL